MVWSVQWTDTSIDVQRHAAVMGNTWGLLIPTTILMARLRNKKGWWFQLHRALAVLSLVLVLVGVVLGRRLRLTHPPVTTAGKLHKFFGYTALTFICLQVSTFYFHILIPQLSEVLQHHALLTAGLADHAHQPQVHTSLSDTTRLCPTDSAHLITKHILFNEASMHFSAHSQEL